MGWRKWLGIPEKRTITDLPWREQVPFNIGPSLSASYEVSAERALSLGAVFAAVRLLAQSISTLPLKAYRRDGDERIPMGKLPPLFDILTTDGQLVPWLHKCVVSLAMRGNAYGLIVSRDGFGFPTVVEWLDPTLVAEDPRPGQTGWLVMGREVPRSQILHIPWFPTPGKKIGMSPIGAYAQTVGVGLNAQTYAADWFNAGGFPTGTFKNSEQTVDGNVAAEMKARLAVAISNRQPLVYGRDWDYSSVTVPPEEAQFIETMKLTTKQIAAIYGIPPEAIGGETGHSMTYQNVEQQSINFVMFTLRPWLVMMETTFSANLPDRQYVRFNSDALIRADTKTRWDVNKIRIELGAASIDEIRAQEDQQPLPNGQGTEYLPRRALVEGTPSGDEASVAPLRRVS